ncbi:hypothetical protein VPH35_139948 [Triticum aestivum]
MGIKASTLRVLLHQAWALFRAPSPAYLPNELISDILSRVPEKSVCRFRCVSTEWRALVSDPVFAAAHKSRAEPFLVVASHANQLGEHLRLVDMDGNIVRVIRDMSEICMPVSTSPDDAVCAIGLMRNGTSVAWLLDLATMKVLAARLEGYEAWGFGRATPSGAYKIVRIRDHTNCEVFTIGDGVGWRQRKSRSLCRKINSLDKCAPTSNGMLYFLTKERQDMDSILCFDLESEEWKNNIKGPQNLDILWHTSLGELNGALCMVETKNWETNHECTNIWLLTDSDKSTWIKAYTVPLSPSIPLDSFKYCWLIPLGMLRDGSKLLFCYSDGLGGAKLGRPPILQIYDPYEGTCIDVTKKLLGDDGSVVGFCRSHLGRVIPAKIQQPISSFRFI